MYSILFLRLYRFFLILRVRPEAPKSAETYRNALLFVYVALSKNNLPLLIYFFISRLLELFSSIFIFFLVIRKNIFFNSWEFGKFGDFYIYFLNSGERKRNDERKNILFLKKILGN